MQPTEKDDRLKSINEKLKLLMQKKGVTLSATFVDKAEKKKQSIKQATQKKEQLKQPDDQKNEHKTKKIKKAEKGIAHQKQKQGHNLRKAAGLVWEDKTMEEWPQNDYRIFVGNLGNQASDQVLANAFRTRYPSFNMARVVRDKRTGKTKGYGFVSFAQPRDFLNSLKQMNGQYIGNRPAKIVKSSWKDRDLSSEQNQSLPSDFKTNSKKETNKIFTDFKYVPRY